jgi:radical SAM protein with 4Fe4S-binding SPASM domain
VRVSAIEGAIMTALREENAVLNHQEFLARQLTLASYPTMVFLELTQNCNLSCLMCRSSRGYDTSLDLAESVFDRVATTLFPYASLIGLNGWGESTILKNFPRRLRTAIDSGARIRMVTNAHAMTAPLWEMFFEGDNILVISIDSADAATFKRLGRGDLPRVKRNIGIGVATRERLGRGHIHFNTVLNSYTVHTLPDVLHMAADLGVDHVLVNPIRTSPDLPSDLHRKTAVIPEILDRSAALAEELGVVLQLGAALDPSLAAEWGLPATCENPWSNVMVEYDGQLSFCHHLLNSPGYETGSLAERSFEEIWNGPVLQEIRRLHIEAEQTRHLPERYSKCTWCYSNRYSDNGGLDSTETDREVSTRTSATLYQRGPSDATPAPVVVAHPRVLPLTPVPASR